MNNVDVYSQITSASLNVDFILPIHQFSNKVTLTNMHFQVKGNVYYNNIASSNLLVENATFDMYESTGGFMYISLCAYEGDLNLASLEFKNIHAYTSKENYLSYGFIFNRGNANITVYNITIEVYVHANDPIKTILFRDLSIWTPQDEVTQVFDVDNMIMKMPDNPLGIKKSGVGHGTPAFSLRHFRFSVTNTLFVNFQNHTKQLIMFFGRYNEEGIVKNITNEGSSFTQW